MATIVDAVTDHINEIETLLAGFHDNASNLDNKLYDIKNDISSYQSLKDNSIKEWNIAQDAYLTDKSRLDEEIKLLEDDKIKISIEVNNLLAKKASLKLENARLNSDIDQFKNYEEKSWKILHAKEDELIGREENIQQRENLKPSTKTLLPLQ